ncbi:ankyrin-2b isoform X1 [Eucyclogobius newberryi]|uniref:ankyrin-2b isoform X1 n=1 Tax=Eucyclogobius newberryi TaxID=166745 RepID=UPI003B59FA05
MSPESDTEYRAHSPKAHNSISLLRSYSQGSMESVDEYKPLSPDSPVPHFECFVHEYYPLSLSRSPSPHSVSDSLPDFFDDSVFAAKSRTSSPNSVRSGGNLPLSADSPVHDFSDGFLFTNVVVCRSSSPESDSSDHKDLAEFSPADFKYDERLSSPEFAEFEPRHLSLETRSLEKMDSMQDERVLTLEYNQEATLDPETQSSLTEMSEHTVFEHPVNLTDNSELSYDCELWRLISQVHDPQYVGETYMCKIGVAKFTETQDQAKLSTDKSRESLPESVVKCGVDWSSSVDSLNSEVELDHNSLRSLENRPLSPNSLDENQLHLHDSPIPQFQNAVHEFTVLNSQERTSSPVSVGSDLDFASASPLHFNESRPVSPGSIDSGDRCRVDSPLPYFRTVPQPTEFISTIGDRSPSPMSISDDEYDQSIVDLDFPRPDSPESHTSEPIDQTYDQNQTLKAVRVPVYRLVYDGELWKLISHIHDPQYEGETYNSKTGVFEYAGTRIEYVLEDAGVRPLSPDSEAEYRPFSPQILQSTSLLRSDSQGTAESTDEKGLPPDSPIPQFDRSIPETCPLKASRSPSPNSLSESEPELCDVNVPRSSSPESVESVSEYRRLSADSPVPDFRRDFETTLGVVGEHASPSCGSVSSQDDLLVESMLEEFNCNERLESPELASQEYGTETRAFSPDSLSEYSPMSLQSLLLTPSRTQSPDSITSLTEFRPLSPDSPVPQFKENVIVNAMFQGSRSSSLVSVSESIDLEYSFFDEPRAGTSNSDYEFCAIPPDSPTPEFKLAVGEQTIFATQSRTSSPVSASYSDLEYGDELLDVFDLQRASSPDSVYSRNEEQALTPDSPVPQFESRFVERFPSFFGFKTERQKQSAAVVSHISTVPLKQKCRSSTPESGRISTTTPEVRHMIEHDTTVKSLRSPSPEIMSSDSETEVDVYSSDWFEDRPSSPESAPSFNSSLRLSPDSPIPHFTPLPTSLEFIFARSVSPESVYSDSDSSPYTLEQIDIELRPDSPLSCQLSDSTNIPPDSPIPQYSRDQVNITTYTRSMSSDWTDSEEDIDSSLRAYWILEDRASSPGSSASEENHQPPDSPIPQFTKILKELPSFDLRCSSPDSVLSDRLVDMDFLWQTDLENRALSPASRASSRLSADPPIPQFCHFERDSSDTVFGVRSASPSSSECSEVEYIGLTLGSHIYDVRPSSPASGLSDNEFRSLSPDSPIPDFTPKTERVIINTGYRSSSLESIESDVEYYIEDLYDGTVDRPNSPDSVELQVQELVSRPFSLAHLPQTLKESVLMPSDSYLASPSIEAVYPDEKTAYPESDDITSPKTADKKTIIISSSEKDLVEAVEVAEYNLVYDAELWGLISQVRDPQYRGETFQSKTGYIQFIGSSIEYLGKDQHAPSLGFTTTEETTVFAYDQDQTKYPSQITEQENLRDDCYRETKCSLEDTAVSCASPHVSAGIRYKANDDVCYSPESIEGRAMTPELAVLLERVSSPESVKSVNELRPLSPDSPVPQFRPALAQCRAFLRSASLSPEPIGSDVEDMLLDNESYQLECRGSSPESMQFEDVNEKKRPLSPESESEYTPISAATAMCMADRTSSPDSLYDHSEDRRLSPDSPIPQFTVNMLDPNLLDLRTSSPESEASLSDYELTVTSERDSYERTSSPDSMVSGRGFRNMSPDSPLPQFRTILPQCETVLRALSVSPEPIDCDVEYMSDNDSIVECRGSSPESLHSEDFDLDPPLSPESVSEYIPMSLDSAMHLLDQRISSPESLPEHSEHRPLTPDSPVPQFADSLEQYSLYFRSLSPVSEAYYSDLEETGPSDIADCERPSSPESTDSISAYRHLMIDSPVPEFMRILSSYFMEGGALGRSSSPVSFSSDSEFIALPVHYWTDHRPRVTTPQSVYSDEELGIDNDMFVSSLLSEYPEFLESAIERASSPESVTSVNELRSLSPDSPVPEFRTAFPQYETLLRSASGSPEPIDSDVEYMLPDMSPHPLDCRASSPDSTYSESIDEKDRPLSPESLTEDTTESLETVMHMDDYRTSSPDSLPEISKYRCLSPDSPIPQFAVELMEVYCPFAKSPRPSSPESEASYSDLELPRTLGGDDCDRHSSPEPSEHRNLTDSPVPGFMRILSSYFMEGSPLLRSTSPVSATSDSEFVALPVDYWINDSPRPLSPQSIYSDEELGNCEASRHLVEDLSFLTVIEPESIDAKPEVTTRSQSENRMHQSKPDVEASNQVQAISGDGASEWCIDLQDSKAQDEMQELQMSAKVPEVGVAKSTLPQKKSPAVTLELLPQTAYSTHRTVTPVLPSTAETPMSSELFSPMSRHFVVPPDYEDIFSGEQSLKVTESSLSGQPGLSPSTSSTVETGAPEEFEFSPDFNRVLAEFESLKTKQQKDSASPQRSDSDSEFFDCKQALSDSSEPEDTEHAVAYHISEPPSPMPGSSVDIGHRHEGYEYATGHFLRAEDYKRFSSGSESLEFAYDSGGSQTALPGCEELPRRSQSGYYDDDDDLGREIAEELGPLSDSSEEEVLTTRVVRRRVIIQADTLPDIPPQTVTEEKYTDEHGNMVIKKITRKVIRKYVSPDGLETQEVTIEGSKQDMVRIEEGDTVSRVVKRTVLHSEGEQRELSFSEPLALRSAAASAFDVEPVQGRKVSKVVKTTVVRGERLEKQTGESSLASDLPSAREDFEKALVYAGGFGKVQLPHVLEREIVQDDGSVVKRSQMRKARTQKRTVVRDGRGKQVHLEREDDTPGALQPDVLQQRLHRLLQQYCQDRQEGKGDKDESQSEREEEESSE